VKIPKTLKVVMEKDNMIITGIDKAEVGQFAANMSELYQKTRTLPEVKESDIQQRSGPKKKKAQEQQSSNI